MKNIFLILSLICLTVLFNACQKDEARLSEHKTPMLKDSETEQIVDSILTFKAMIDSARIDQDYAEETNLSLDEAVWNIEALLNYTYADASTTFERFHLDTVFVEFDVQQTTMMLITAVNVMDQMVDSLSALYSAIEEEDKLLVLADVELESTDGTTAFFRLTAGFGKGSIESWFSSFTSEDYWKYGWGWMNWGGYCDGLYSGTHTDSDAAEQIEIKRNYRISLPMGHSYFVDICQVIASTGTMNIEYVVPSGNNIVCQSFDLLNPDDGTLDDNWKDYLLWYNYSENPGFHDCLCPEEMNYYLGGAHQVIYTLAYSCFSNQLQGKSFIAVDIEGEALFPPEESIYFHHTTTCYGTSIITSSYPLAL